MEDVDPSRSLRPKSDLTEFSLVHQLQREKVHLLEMNKHYLATMAQLEVKFADCRTVLKLRDRELELIRGSTQQGDAISLVKDLEEKVALLEEENKQLRHAAALSGDVERLRGELAQAIELKTSYEYQLPSSRPLSSDQEEAGALDDLQADSESLAQIRRANQVLHDELETAMRDYQKMKQERDFLRSEVIPVLEQTIKLYELEKNEIDAKMRELQQREIKLEEEKTSDRPKTTMKSRTESERLIQTQLVRPKSSLSPKQQVALSQARVAASTHQPNMRRSTQSASYGFLRGKKTRMINTPHSKGRSSLKVIDDNFADDFPEENELV